MSYSEATWRIAIGKGSFVEVSIKGNHHGNEVSPPDAIVLAGSVLKDVGRSMKRLQAKYTKSVQV